MLTLEQVKPYTDEYVKVDGFGLEPPRQKFRLCYVRDGKLNCVNYLIPLGEENAWARFVAIVNGMGITEAMLYKFEYNKPQPYPLGKRRIIEEDGREHDVDMMRSARQLYQCILEVAEKLPA